MKKSLLQLLAAAVIAGTAVTAGATMTGCQPGQVVPPNVISIAQVVSSTAQTVINEAQTVWPAILATRPQAEQAADQDAFNKAVFTANHVILTLNDAIQVAIASNAANPSFDAIFSQVADAVAQVVAIVQNFQSSPAVARVSGNGVDVVADMNAAVAHIREASKK